MGVCGSKEGWRWSILAVKVFEHIKKELEAPHSSNSLSLVETGLALLVGLWLLVVAHGRNMSETDAS